MESPSARLLEDGRRLHLHHGPIDLVLEAEADTAEAIGMAYEGAAVRFATVLEELVSELAELRSPLLSVASKSCGMVATRMRQAALPFCEMDVLTPMIAVAGAVSDEIMHAMLDAAPLRRAYVNNGGDIAVHLSGSAEYAAAIAVPGGVFPGRLRFGAQSGIGGIATSGAGGRSLSLGVADAVTVLARSAAEADVAATLIANAVDLPDHTGIERAAANTLQPDSDLGDRLVVTAVPRLSARERDAALEWGRLRAESMLEAGMILGCVLILQGGIVQAGGPFALLEETREMDHA